MKKTQHVPRRILLGFLIAVPLMVGAAAVLISWRENSYDANIRRLTHALPTTTTRPVQDPGNNWLLVGSDHRGPSNAQKWQLGQSDSDTIMLLHLPRTGRRAFIISFPRDAWVQVPGHGMHKISAAYALGGPRLLTETVEALTGIRIDHVAAIDFRGFRQLTDVLGGVDVYLKNPVVDPSNGWSWPAGRNHLDGRQALQFVRERKGLPAGDRDRIKRQQAFIKALAEKAASTGTVSNPWKLDSLLQAASKSLAVDEGTSFAMVRSLALRLIRVGPDRVTFVSLPIASTAWIGDQNVAHLDETTSQGLYEAVREGGLTEYVARHGLDNDVERVD